MLRVGRTDITDMDRVPAFLQVVGEGLMVDKAISVYGRLCWAVADWPDCMLSAASLHHLLFNCALLR